MRDGGGCGRQRGLPAQYKAWVVAEPDSDPWGGRQSGPVCKQVSGHKRFLVERLK